MPSVVGLLEQRELAARRRVDELREEADRIAAEIAVAEQDWKEWVIARARGGEVLAPVDDCAAVPDAGQDLRDPQPIRPEPSMAAAKPRSMVPVWRAGLAWSVLSVDYQRIVRVLAGRERLGHGALSCQEMAAVFGMEPVPAKSELFGREICARKFQGLGRVAVVAISLSAGTDSMAEPKGWLRRHQHSGLHLMSEGGQDEAGVRIHCAILTFGEGVGVRKVSPVPFPSAR